MYKIKATKEAIKKMQTQLIEPVRSKKQLKTIVFKKAVPKFVDLNLKVIGPFEPGDVLRTDIDIANLLIVKNKAKEFDID